MPKYLKHEDLEEFRRRIKRVQMAQGKAQEEQILFQRWVNGIGSAYGLGGSRFQIDPDSGEFQITPERARYSLDQTLTAVAFQDFSAELAEIAAALDGHEKEETNG